MMIHQTQTPKDVMRSPHSRRICSSGSGISVPRDRRSMATDVGGTMSREREEELFHLWQSLGLRTDCRPRSMHHLIGSDERSIPPISSGRYRHPTYSLGMDCPAPKKRPVVPRSRLRPILASETRSSHVSSQQSKEAPLSRDSPCNVTLAQKRLMNLELRKKARQFNQKYPTTYARNPSNLMPSQLQPCGGTQHATSHDAHESVEETLARARELMDRTKILLAQRRHLLSRSFRANQSSSKTSSSLSRPFANSGAKSRRDSSRCYREPQNGWLHKNDDACLESSTAYDLTTSTMGRSVWESCRSRLDIPNNFEKDDFPDDEIENVERCSRYIEGSNSSNAERSQAQRSDSTVRKEQDGNMAQATCEKQSSTFSVLSISTSSSLPVPPNVGDENTVSMQNTQVLPLEKEPDSSSCVTVPTANVLMDTLGSVSDFKKGAFAPAKQLSSNGSSHGATLDEAAEEEAGLSSVSSPKPLRWNVLKTISLRPLLGGTAHHGRQGSKEASAALTLSTSLDHSDTSESDATQAVAKSIGSMKEKDSDGCTLGPGLLLCRKDQVVKDEWYRVKAVEQLSRRQQEEEQTMEMVFYD